jgi:hypothetical protein
MKMMTYQQEATLKGLQVKTKQEVFKLYCQVCLGRIHGADIKEMRKDWMIYDILKAWRIV